MIPFLVATLTAAALRRCRRLGRPLLLAVLVILAAAAAFSYLNGFAFHGSGHFVHDHDVAHYYLGAKYLPELSYSGLYAALLAAEAEDTGVVSVAVARDLRSNRLLAADTVLAGGPAVRARFAEHRWHEFRRDAAAFRQVLGNRYPHVLVDHGFNGTPLWALVGGALTRLVPAHSAPHVLALCLLDPLLLAAALVAVAGVFRVRVALLAAILFWTVFGAGFGWTGGAFLRYFWLAAVLVACCCLHRRQHGAAGVLFALATMLRLVPAVFVLGIAAKVAWARLGRGAGGRRSPERGHVRFLASFAASCAGLFLITRLLPGGFFHWWSFAENLRLHLGTEASNNVGLERVLAWPLAQLLPAWQGEVAAALDVVHAAAVMLTMTAVVLLARRRDDLEATALGGLVLFATFSMAAYDYVFLLVLVLAFRRQPRALALIFFVEGLSHLLPFFVGVFEAVYVLRSLLLLLLFGALYLPDAVHELARRRAAAIPRPLSQAFL